MDGFTPATWESVLTPQAENPSVEGQREKVREIQEPNRGSAIAAELKASRPAFTPTTWGSIFPGSEPATKPAEPKSYSDTSNLLGQGAAAVVQGVTYPLDKLLGGSLGRAFESHVGRNLNDIMNDVQEHYQSQLSPEQQAAGKKEFISSKEGETLGDAWTDPKAFKGLIVSNLPSMLPGFGAAALASRGARVYGTAAAQAAMKSGVAAPAAAKIGQEAAVKAATRIGFVAGAATEGIIGGGQQGAQTEQEIMNMPEDKLAQSQFYQGLLKSMSPKEARRQIASDAGTQAMLVAGAIDGVTGGAFDAYLAKLLTGGGSGSLLREIGRGLGRESATETAQSGGEQLATNLAVQQQADPTRPAMQGVANQAVAGGIAGAVMGAGAGGLGSMGAKGPEAPPEQPPDVQPPPTPPAPPIAPAAPAGGPPEGPGGGPVEPPPGGPGNRTYPKTDSQGRPYRDFASGSVLDGNEKFDPLYPGRAYPAEQAPPLPPIDQARADAEILRSGQTLDGIDEQRQTNATLMAVYGENAAVRHVIEAPDGFRAVGEAMVRMAPRVQQIRETIAARPESLDVATDIVDALDGITRLHTEGRSIGEFLATGIGHDLSYEAQHLAAFMAENAGDSAAIADMMDRIMLGVEQAGGLPAEARNKGHQIAEELRQQQLKKEAEVAKEKEKKTAEKAKRTAEFKAREQAQSQNVETAIAVAKAAGSGINTGHVSAIELAFQNARKLKGKSNAKLSAKQSPKDGGGIPAATPTGPKGGAGPREATGGAGAVPGPRQANAPGNAQPGVQASRGAGAQDADKNRGKQIAAELSAVDRAAHEAATSNKNNLPQPTEAQKEAGNYKKGPVRVSGMDISIENPAGTKRRPEWPTLEGHYGYVKDVPARAPDKEHVDVFVKPGTSEDHNGPVFVIDQNHADGKFDEPKAMIGYRNAKEARSTYLKNYTKGWESRVRGIHEMTTAQFKEKLQDANAFLKPQNRGAQIAKDMAERAGKAADLRRMAGEAGWAERGGKLLRDGKGASADEIAAGHAQSVGDVVGRTKWIPRAGRFQAMRQQLGNKGLSDEGQISKAAEDYIAGKPLKPAAQRTVDWMIDEIDRERQEFAEQHQIEADALEDDVTIADLLADDIEPSGQELVIADLMASAVVKDADAAERAAIQHEGDDAALIAALKGIVDENIEPEAAGRGAEGGGEASEVAGNAQAEVAPLELTAPTPDELAAKAAEQEARDKAVTAEADKVEATAKAERDRKEIAQRSQGAEFSLEATEAVDKKTQAAIDAKTAQDQLAGQKDIFSSPSQPATPSDKPVLTFAGRAGKGIGQHAVKEAIREQTRLRSDLEWRAEPSGLENPWQVSGYAKAVGAEQGAPSNVVDLASFRAVIETEKRMDRDTREEINLILNDIQSASSRATPESTKFVVEARRIAEKGGDAEDVLDALDKAHDILYPESANDNGIGTEQRRTPYNENQLQLIYETLEQRPDTTPAQRQLGIAALRGLYAGDRRAGATLLGSSLWREFQEHGGAELIGQTANSPQELALLAQILRDPRFETMRVFFTKDNKIVEHTGWTMRLPGAVAFGIEGGINRGRGDIGKAMTGATSVNLRLGLLKNQMEQLGADGYYLLHNHPSGSALPSVADERMTIKIADALPGFKGHVVIDHNEIGVINKHGMSRVDPISSPQTETPELAHNLLGMRVTNPAEVGELDKMLQTKKGYVTLISTAGNGRVTALAEVPEALLLGGSEIRNLRAMTRIRRFMKMTGSAGHAFLIGADPKRFDWLLKRAAVTDVIGTYGEASRATMLGNTGAEFGRSGAKTVYRAEDTRTPYNVLATAPVSARNLFDDMVRSDRELNRVISKVNTPYHIAETHPDFKPVYDEAQDYNHDVSRYVKESADIAADLLPTIESFADFKKMSPSTQDIKVVSDALYSGTLFGGGNPLKGRKWTKEELLSGRAIDKGVGIPMFAPASESQANLYEQAINSAAHSLEEGSKSIIWRLAKQKKIPLHANMTLDQMVSVANELAQQQIEGKTDAMAIEGQDAAALQKEIDELKAFKESVDDIQKKTQGLIDRGYFPAKRFGAYAVNVQKQNKDGTWTEQWFERFESQSMANIAKRRLAAQFPESRVSGGVMNDEAYKLFQGLNLDALELFAKHMIDEQGKPIDSDPIMQQFFRMAVSERSTLKQQIHRKGIAGFSNDIPRVLAQFTVSNATMTSRNYHAAGMMDKVRAIKAGDLQAYATRYVKYLQDPAEEAAALRGVLANYYILGSLAFGAVNMTQPLLMTAPFLSAHTSWGNAMKQLAIAAKDMLNHRASLTPDEKQAYDKAVNAGTVSPQEIHQIRAESRSSMIGDSPLWQKMESMAAAKGIKLPGKLIMRKAAFLWGSIYSMTEQWNRGITFLAAYRIGKENGIDAYEFARNAVDATQGVYARSNRPEISRGMIGAPLMTFRQFGISYVELAQRLYKQDKKAFAILMLTLIVLAGTEGLPFAEDVEDVIDTIGQWMGYSTNSKKAVRKFATEALGADIANVLLHGFSAIPGVPIDVAQRVGSHNLLPGSAMLKTSEADKTRDIVEILGPAATLLKNAGVAAEGLFTGKPEDMKGLMPLALQNISKGAEMLEKGQYRDMKGRKVMDVNGLDAFVKIVGFQPSKVAAESRIVGQNMQDIALHKIIEASIADKFARGIVDGDKVLVEKAKDQWREWNANNPAQKIVIQPNQITSRVRELRLSREDRFLKSAPKEIRSAVRADMRQ